MFTNRSTSGLFTTSLLSASFLQVWSHRAVLTGFFSHQHFFIVSKKTWGILFFFRLALNVDAFSVYINGFILKQRGLKELFFSSVVSLLSGFWAERGSETSLSAEASEFSLGCTCFCFGAFTGPSLCSVIFLKMSHVTGRGAGAHRLYVKMAACCLHCPNKTASHHQIISRRRQPPPPLRKPPPLTPTTEPLAAIVLLFPPQEILKSWAWVQTRGLHACFEKNTLQQWLAAGRIFWPCGSLHIIDLAFVLPDLTPAAHNVQYIKRRQQTNTSRHRRPGPLSEQRRPSGWSCDLWFPLRWILVDFNILNMEEILRWRPHNEVRFRMFTI